MHLKRVASVSLYLSGTPCPEGAPATAHPPTFARLTLLGLAWQRVSGDIFATEPS